MPFDGKKMESEMQHMQKQKKINRGPILEERKSPINKITSKLWDTLYIPYGEEINTYVNRKSIEIEKEIEEYIFMLEKKGFKPRMFRGKNNIFKKAIEKFFDDTHFMNIAIEITKRSKLIKKYENRLDCETNPKEITIDVMYKGMERVVKSIEGLLEDLNKLTDANASWEEVKNGVEAYVKLAYGDTIPPYVKSTWVDVYNIINGEDEEKLKFLKDVFINTILPSIRRYLNMSTYSILNYPYAIEGEDYHIPGQIFRIAAHFIKETVERMKNGEEKEEIKRTIGKEIRTIINRQDVLTLPFFVGVGKFYLSEYIDHLLHGGQKESMNKYKSLYSTVVSIPERLGIPSLNPTMVLKSLDLNLQEIIERTDILPNKSIVDDIKGESERKKSIEEDMNIFWGNLMKKLGVEKNLMFFPSELPQKAFNILKRNRIDINSIRVFSYFTLGNDEGRLAHPWYVPDLLKEGTKEIIKPILVGVDAKQVVEASTDGIHIYITPFYGVLPTYPLNRNIYLEILIHETRHIAYDSFKIDTTNTRPNLEDYSNTLKEILNKDLTRDLKIIEDAFERAIEKTYRLVKSTSHLPHYIGEDFGAPVTVKGIKYSQLLKELIKNVEKELDKIKLNDINDERITLFVELMKTTLPNIVEIIEDYRVDHAFIYDKSLRDKFLTFNQEGGEEEKMKDSTKIVYNFARYVLLRKAFYKWMEEANREEKNNASALINLLLVYTKMDDVFFKIIDESDMPKEKKEKIKKILSILETVKEHTLPKEDAKKGEFGSLDKGIISSLEYLLITSLIIEDIQRESKNASNAMKKIKKKNDKSTDKKQGSKGGGGRGKGQENEGSEQSGGGSGEKEKKDRKEEGSGSREGRSKDKNQEDGEIKKKADERIKRNAEESGDPTSGDLEKGDGYITEKKSKKSTKGGRGGAYASGERQVEKKMMVFISEKAVEEYKKVLKEIKYGNIKAYREFSKRWGRIDLKKLIKFIWSLGKTNKSFLSKRKSMFTKKGYYLYPRPINIYLVIDSSSSMRKTPYLDYSDEIARAYENSKSESTRKSWALYNSLAMILAYKELLKDKDFNGVTIKVIGVDESGRYISQDGREIAVTKLDNGYSVNLDDVTDLGGGTDLAGMVEKAVDIIKDEENNVKSNVYRGKSKLALNPSLLFLFFTDFGDNFGGARMEGALDRLREMSEIYREDSEIQIEGFTSQASVGILFVSPDSTIDDEYTFNKIKNALSLPGAKDPKEERGAFTMEKGEKLINNLKKLIEIYKYKGTKNASNIETEE